MVNSPGLPVFLPGKYSNWKNCCCASQHAEIDVCDSVFRNAYLHFEALSDHGYDFFCSRCGYHPSILVWDLCKKGCFSMARKLSQLAHFISVFKSFIAAVYSRNKGIQNTDYSHSQNIYLMSGIFSLKMANIALWWNSNLQFLTFISVIRALWSSWTLIIIVSVPCDVFIFY